MVWLTKLPSGAVFGGRTFEELFASAGLTTDDYPVVICSPTPDYLRQARESSDTGQNLVEPVLVSFGDECFLFLDLCFELVV